MCKMKIRLQVVEKDVSRYRSVPVHNCTVVQVFNGFAEIEFVEFSIESRPGWGQR